MNYGELKARLSSTLHRTDLDAQLPAFVADAQDRICRRFTIDLDPLVDDADTDPVLATSHLLYFYAAMAEAYRFLRDDRGAAQWDQAWEVQASREVLSGRTAFTDPWTDADGPPAVKVMP